MRSLLILYLSLILCSSLSIGQNRIINSGSQIPACFQYNSRTDVDLLVKGDASIADYNDKKSFYLINAAYVDQLYHSGLVVFGTKLNEYLDALADELLRNNPEIRKRINIYIVKSIVPNAYTTLNGDIFFNIGLLARIDSKDEIAFVLAHEISHFIKGHALDRFLNNKEIEENTKRFDKGANLRNTLGRCVFSQDNEQEADLIGLELFENAGFSWNAIRDVFTLLKQSDLPIYTCDLSPTFFESTQLNINDSIFIDGHRAKSIDSLTKEDAKYSTHPAPEERMEVTIAKARKINSEINRDPKLLELTKQCQRELLCLYNENYDFFSAMYYARYLLSNNPNDSLLNYEMARALYGISKFRTNKKRDYIKPWLNQRYNQFYYNAYDFLRKEANAIDVCAIAREYTRNYMVKYDYRRAEMNAIVLDLERDYNDLKKSMSHKWVEFSPASTNEESVKEMQIVFYHIDDEQKVGTVYKDSVVLVNPEFAIDFLKGEESPSYLSESMDTRFEFAKDVKEIFATNTSLVLDQNLINSDEVQQLNNIYLLDRFVEESQVVSIINSYVSRYSIEVNEFVKNTGLNQLVKINCQPTRNQNAQSVYSCIVIDLDTGKTLFEYQDFDATKLTKTTAEKHLRKIDRKLSK